MKKVISAITMSIMLLMGCNQAFAENQTWKIDQAHSNIYFDIRHIYATVRGFFGDFSGTVIHDTENPLNSRVEFEVNVDSINTNITKRDDHLRSDDFFAAGKFPRMTFKSTGVRHVKDDKYILEGNLTVKDVTQKISVPFTYLGMRESPVQKGTMVAGLEAGFTINPLDYHVGSGKFYDMGVLGKEVHILVTLELLRDR